MSLPYVRERYNVPAFRGARVEWMGVPGTIISASNHLRIKMNCGRKIRVHPTCEHLRYIEVEAKQCS